MGLHVKSDSEVTTDASTPPRSPRRPLYYVHSPSHDLVEKLSYTSTPPFASPNHFHYHCSPIHHSRESSSRPTGGGWLRIHSHQHHTHHAIPPSPPPPADDSHIKFYLLCFLLSFLFLFTIFSFILWAASLPYKPHLLVKSIVLESLYVQAGMDGSGVATDMLTLKSTVRMEYRNRGSFFGVHVRSTPVELHYYNIKVGSGSINKFYQSRKSGRKLKVVIEGKQVALYGGIPTTAEPTGIWLPLNLTLAVQSRAYILGRLVKTKFYSNVLCEVRMREKHLGKPLNLTRFQSCLYL